jgi:hypothetical protein
MIFIIAMIRKIKIHFVFAVFMFTVYIISNFIYGRSLSDLFYVFLYYLAIAGIVFCINLVRKRKIRWAIFLLVLVIPFTYIIFTGTNVKYSSSLEVLELGAKLDVPFLPDLFFQIKDKTILAIVFYLIYFVLPLIYFYAVYALSKMIFSQEASIKK